MIKYSQPSFYKFSEDSTKLANLVIKDSVHGSLLDICCGCGIIGIEIAQKCQIDKLSLVEIQQEYREHIEENLENFLVETEARIEISNFLELNFDQKFDSIVLNPPYFDRQKSRPSPDKNKEICRSYSNGEISKIVSKAIECLNLNGALYIVIRDNDALKEIESASRGLCEVKELMREGENLFLRLTHLDVN